MLPWELCCLCCMARHGVCLKQWALQQPVASALLPLPAGQCCGALRNRCRPPAAPAAGRQGAAAPSLRSLAVRTVVVWHGAQQLVLLVCKLARERQQALPARPSNAGACRVSHPHCAAAPRARGIHHPAGSGCSNSGRRSRAAGSASGSECGGGGRGARSCSCAGSGGAGRGSGSDGRGRSTRCSCRSASGDCSRGSSGAAHGCGAGCRCFRCSTVGSCSSRCRTALTAFVP